MFLRLFILSMPAIDAVPMAAPFRGRGKPDLVPKWTVAVADNSRVAPDAFPTTSTNSDRSDGSESGSLMMLETGNDKISHTRSGSGEANATLEEEERRNTFLEESGLAWLTSSLSHAATTAYESKLTAEETMKVMRRAWKPVGLLGNAVALQPLQQLMNETTILARETDEASKTAMQMAFKALDKQDATLESFQIEDKLRSLDALMGPLDVSGHVVSGVDDDVRDVQVAAHRLSEWDENRYEPGVDNPNGETETESAPSAEASSEFSADANEYTSPPRDGADGDSGSDGNPSSIEDDTASPPFPDAEQANNNDLPPDAIDASGPDRPDGFPGTLDDQGPAQF